MIYVADREIIFRIFFFFFCRVDVKVSKSKYRILQFVLRKQELDREFDYLYAKGKAVLIKFRYLSKLW